MGKEIIVTCVNYLFSFELDNGFYLFFNYFIVVQLQLPAFSPHSSTPPQPNSLPSPASNLPLGFVHVSFIVVPENPSPHYPFPPPLWLLLIVLNFNVCWDYTLRTLKHQANAPQCS